MKTTIPIHNVTLRDADVPNIFATGICLTTGAVEAMLDMNLAAIVRRLTEEGETAAIEMANTMMSSAWTLLVMRKGHNKVLDARQYSPPLPPVVSSQDSASTSGVLDAL